MTMTSRVLFAAGLLLALVAAPTTAQDAERVWAVDQQRVDRSTEGASACLTGNPIIVQPPNQVQGIFSDGDCDLCGAGAQAIGDSATFTEDVSIGELVAWGGWSPGAVPPADDIIVIIHADGGGGIPGAALFTFTGLTSTRVDTGSEYQFNIALPEVVDLAAGTYWFEFENNTVGSPESFYWGTGDLDPTYGTLGFAFAVQVPGVNWFPVGTDNLAWVLCEAPAPNPLEIPTVNVLGLALLALLLVGGSIVVMRRHRIT